LLGGITEHVHHFCVEAKKLGIRPVIITSHAGKDDTAERHGIDIIRIGRSLPIYSNGSIARVTFCPTIHAKLKEIFKSEKFDIVHIHSPIVPVLPLMAQRHSTSINIGTFHTQFKSSGTLRFLAKRAKVYFDALHGRIAVSDLCIDSMDRYFKGDYKVIPNGVDINKFRPGLEKVPEFNDGVKNIFFLSRLEPRNGLDYLIAAFNKIAQDRDDCRLIVGGDGPLKFYYKSLVAKHASKRVHFLGRVNSSRPNYYSTADIFCFPTTRASFGITILEAMATGLPVVAFSMPAYEGILKNGEEGVLCGEPGVDNFADAINQLLDSPQLRSRIGARAMARAADFSWDKVTRQIVCYYEEVKRNS
jgi:phosphatidylinositol alpha-mannosyltransferase